MRNRPPIFWVRAHSFANFLNDSSQIALKWFDSSKAHDDISQDSSTACARKVTTRLEKYTNLVVSGNWITSNNFDLFVGTTRGRTPISSYVPKASRVLITTRNQVFQGTAAAATDAMQVRPNGHKRSQRAVPNAGYR